MALASITSSVTSAIGDWGLYAVFLLMVLDALLPAASELVMVYAGAVAAGAFAGQYVTLFGERIDSPFWAFLAMALAGALGNTVGSLIGWGVGAYGGRPFLERSGRLFHVTPAKLDRAERWFERFGDAAVFFARITPLVRSFISYPAGIVRMPLGRFTLFTFAGCLVWTLALTGVGWALGSNWDRFHDAFRYVDYVVIAVVVGVAVFLILRAFRTQRAPSADTQD